jgi:hypothetical protein
MLTYSLPMDAASVGRFTRSLRRLEQAVTPLSIDRRRGFRSRHNGPAGTRGLQGGRAADAACATVEISPQDTVRRSYLRFGRYDG